MQSALVEAIIEDQLPMTCADVNEIDLKLWRKPSKIQLINVTLAPRDEYADKGVPLEDRPHLLQAQRILQQAKIAN